MSELDKGLNFLGFNIRVLRRNKKIPKKITPIIKKIDDVEVLPPGRVSRPDYTQNSDDYIISGNYDYITPSFILDSIEVIRKLYKVNEDVGSVLNDLIQLTNTGHEINFDQDANPALVKKMKRHLKEVSKEWGSGMSGIDSIIDKWIAQIWVGGALSNEWVPKRDLSGIQVNSLVNPENIRFKYNKITSKYESYQKVKGLINKEFIKLNPLTYKYLGLMNDIDEPYGVPPFLTALSAIETQQDMKKNINHILKQLGLLGYLETKVTKPEQLSNESTKAYELRLNNLLIKTKQNVQAGFMEGVVVGFDEDHEFEFNSTTKNLSGVGDLYNQNEIQIASGLKTSPAFLGISQGGTETNMGIVFTKMLSQLKNVQSILAFNLEYGYKLELIMAGFSFKSLKVKFKPSTITDDLKIQQGREIKQRINHNLRIDGIIDQDEYANDMGYDSPHEKEPIVPFDQQSGNKTDSEKKGEREKDKDTSDRTGRDKKKKQPRRKDADSKKR